MNTFIEDLAAKRRQFLAGLDANEGDINLDIFEDFYPDQAHFIYELLQNAEDAEATEVEFALWTDGCTFEHNGRKTFTKADVKAITGIHNSTKAKSDDKIGKFGVGFKSVFVYTSTPTIWSREFSFKIAHQVLPEQVALAADLGDSTRFRFPFNNPRKNASEAYKEIEHGLNDLSETTLLFLSNIQSIRWSIGSSSKGKILRLSHSEHHIEVLKELSGKPTQNSHYLRFTTPVDGLSKQAVAVAFDLEFLPKVKKYRSEKLIAKQLKIAPARPGKVAVFFPASKETSGLRFHLHAPFVPELSRASIKNTDVNEPLFEQLANVAAKSMHLIKGMGLLSGEFLGVLPNRADELPERYEPIRKAIVTEFNNEALTPTHSGCHAPAKYLLQARAALKELLSRDDLAFLHEDRRLSSQWVIGAPQKNGLTDRFLSSLRILNWDIEAFIEILDNNTDSYGLCQEIDGFYEWLESKSSDWHQQLYVLLYNTLYDEGELSEVKSLRLVRISDGSYVTGGECYFPTSEAQHDEAFPRVDGAVYSSGNKKKQQAKARKFLEEIGVREVGEKEQILILIRNYTKSRDSWDMKVYKRDLERFVAFVEKEPDSASLFHHAYIFKFATSDWGIPLQAFLDEPFIETGLGAYFEALAKKDRKQPLSEWYDSCGISNKKLCSFAKLIGVQSSLIIQQIGTYSHPRRSKLRVDYYARNTHTGIDENWTINKLEILIEQCSVALSQLIWRTIRKAGSKILRARFRPNQEYQTREEPSSLVLMLRKADWIPQIGGTFVRPSKATRDLLPNGFPFDFGETWLKAIRFEEEQIQRSDEHQKRESVAKEIGFGNAEELEQGMWFANLPDETKERIRADQRSQEMELPERESSNPDRRASRVAANAADAPERVTEKRSRAVSVAREAVKDEATAYLRQQYSNDGVMICQICKRELPFKLADGSYYFERVEFLSDIKKHQYQNYLALCPNHSAMFSYVNESKEIMRDMLPDIEGDKLEVILAGADETIYFTKMHLADLLEVIKVDQASEDS